MGVGFIRTDAEVSAGVIPVTYAYSPYVRGRYASFTDWRLACDQAGAEGSLDADYAITSAIYLPNCCDFNGFKITGLFQTIHAYRSGGWVKGWRASRPFSAGCYYCEYTGIDTLGDADVDKLLIMGGDGVGPNHGSFWNKFHLVAVGVTELNCDRFDVNQNTFYGGISRYNRITGGGPGVPFEFGVGQAHNNLWFKVDMSKSTNMSPYPGGFLQDDPVRSKNFFLGCYYENGSQISGNVSIDKYQGDGTGLPLLDRMNHIMNSVGLNARLGRDFFELSVHNIAVGGLWDILDSTGKPPSFSNVGGGSVTVVADTTEPSGCGYRYQCDFADAFDEFRITMQPCGTDRFACYIRFKSTAEFTAIESLADGVSTSHNTDSVADKFGNDWKILRISSTASKTAVTTIRLFAYSGSGGATKTMSLGGVFAGAEYGIVSPQRPTIRCRFGSATYNPPSLADGAGATTSVTVTGAALGDFAVASFDKDLQGIIVTPSVSAANTVSVRFQNETGGVIDLASGTLRVQTQSPFA